MHHVDRAVGGQGLWTTQPCVWSPLPGNQQHDRVEHPSHINFSSSVYVAQRAELAKSNFLDQSARRRTPTTTLVKATIHGALLLLTQHRRKVQVQSISHRRHAHQKNSPQSPLWPQGRPLAPPQSAPD